MGREPVPQHGSVQPPQSCLNLRYQKSVTRMPALILAADS
jgi:hypothetical protein